MAAGDGDGWVRCDQGHRHWGRFGAAGLLAWAQDRDSGARCILLQQRSSWSHHGGTWGTPGGARDSHEPAVPAALREAAEECGLPAGAVSVQAVLIDDHGGWSYQTVVASATGLIPVSPASLETSAVRWVGEADVAELTLHPDFATRWPLLRQALQPVTVIVDVANVMGSRPDGWWRDRAGAARRLAGQLSELARAGIAALPHPQAPALDLWYPQLVLVVEGAARPAADTPDSSPGTYTPAVQIVAAPGSGDDTIAGLARDTAGLRLAVTADRELRQRCLAGGAAVTGPSWLLSQL